MADTDTLAPSDILTSASDELGDALAAVRAQALAASGKNRDRLFDLYKDLIGRQQEIMIQDLRTIDKDPAVVAAIQQLAMLTQQISKVTREMTTAKQAIDGATKVLGFVDQILGVVAKAAG